MALIANTNQAFAYGVPTLYGKGSGNDLYSESYTAVGSPVFTGNNTCREVRVATDFGLVGILEKQNDADVANVHIIETDGTSVQNFRVPSTSTSLIGTFDFTFGMSNGRMIIADPYYNGQTGRVLVYDYGGTLLHTLTLQTASQYGSEQYGGNAAIGCGRIVVGSPLWSTGGGFPGLYEVWDYDGNYINNLQPPFSSVTTSLRAYGSTSSRVAIGCGKIAFVASSDGTSALNIIRICDLNLNPLYDIDPSTLTNFGNGIIDNIAVGCGLIAVIDSPDCAIYDLDTGQLVTRFEDNTVLGPEVALRFGRLVIGTRNYDDRSQTDSGAVFVLDVDSDRNLRNDMVNNALPQNIPYKYFLLNSPVFDANLGNGVAIGYDYVVIASNDGDSDGAPAKVYVEEISTGITPYDILEQQSYGY